VINVKTMERIRLSSLKPSPAGIRIKSAKIRTSYKETVWNSSMEARLRRYALVSP